MAEERHKLKIYTMTGVFEIWSPVDNMQFMRELKNDLRVNVSLPEWEGVYEFTQTNGNSIASHIQDIRHVEEVKKKTRRSSKASSDQSEDRMGTNIPNLEEDP